ncbi:uncharacterized protein LOC131614222 [Vicia villosa]|uniref:uncharacterized protein LOC131614222 n=1 Tax=Vicia villosa TaxID=3911 RepID=UPI00273AFEFD|nr:uncharacterized protein LOC131614222 [Vicia villosa]
MLKINANKSNIYFANVDKAVKSMIMNLSGFREGSLPFRYLGVPLSSKKLNIFHYLGLVDKIVCRIRHWTARFLSYAGRLQLINSVTFSMANYWLMVFPIPKAMIKKINAICRSFLWSGTDVICWKSTVAWDDICKPKKKEALVLLIWRLGTIVLCFGCSRISRSDIMDVKVTNNSTWIMRKILDQREFILQNPTVWNSLLSSNKFQMKTAYKSMINGSDWGCYGLLQNKHARPRARFILWLACRKILATKSRLMRLGFISNNDCVFLQEGRDNSACDF